MDVLINQLDKHNQGSILAVKKFEPKEVIYIRGKDEKSEMELLKRYYANNMPSISFREIVIEEGDFEKLEMLLNENIDRNILVNLTGGKRINSLILLKICNDKNIENIYVDIKEKRLYKIGNDVKNISEEFEDLEIVDIIEASGGEVVEDSNKLCEKEDLVYLTKKIYKHLNLWHKYKQKLYDSNIFVHDCTNSKVVTIKLDILDKEERNFLNNILKELKDMGGIDYRKKNEKEIEVKFNNDYLKGFIFKSGTWLEMATNMMVNEISDIDEVKSGFIFLWNDKVKVVRNEVDVVAMKDSVAICISCKDSDKYNEVALNELNVYSSQIGGEKTYKILVATKEPIKASVKERAKEMGISIVVFDGDENKFKNQIKAIIKK